MDRDALASVYARYSGLVHRRARQLLRNDQAAADACHEVFMRLWASQPALVAGSPLSWLYQVTTNYCLNVLRDSRRRDALLAAHAPTDQHAATQAHSLALLLRGVPEHLHELGVYYFVDEMTQEEIAQLMNLSQRTICTRLKQFRDFLGKAWEARVEEAS